MNPAADGDQEIISFNIIIYRHVRGEKDCEIRENFKKKIQILSVLTRTSNPRYEKGMEKALDIFEQLNDM